MSDVSALNNKTNDEVYCIHMNSPDRKQWLTKRKNPMHEERMNNKTSKILKKQNLHLSRR